MSSSKPPVVRLMKPLPRTLRVASLAPNGRLTHKRCRLPRRRKRGPKKVKGQLEITKELTTTKMSRSTISKVPFHSEEGKKMLEESASQPILIKLFKKQENNTFCGIHSCAMAMSAQHLGHNGTVSEGDIDPKDIPYSESNMFSFEETKQALSFEVVDSTGMTLDELQKLLQSHGKNFKCTYAMESTLAEFRDQASTALGRSDSAVIVNYDEYQLEQDDVVHGHFSPLAGYHKGRDMFLLLDTWFNTTDVWVGAKDLFDAMHTVDPDCGESRGWIILDP